MEYNLEWNAWRQVLYNENSILLALAKDKSAKYCLNATPIPQHFSEASSLTGDLELKSDKELSKKEDRADELDWWTNLYNLLYNLFAYLFWQNF